MKFAATILLLLGIAIAGGGLSDSIDQRAAARISAACSPSAIRSAPAIAIIAPLSVQYS
jgi:hypothetical protein